MKIGKELKAKESKSEKVKKSKSVGKIKEPEDVYKTLNSLDDHAYIQKNLGKLVKVTETEYIQIEKLNVQDMEDIRQIKGLEKIADVRRK